MSAAIDASRLLALYPALAGLIENGIWMPNMESYYTEEEMITNLTTE